MDSQSSPNQTSDLARELREAEEAQAEAEAAMRRAAAARAEAESAHRRAREEQEASRRAWAQNIVDTYDTDLAAAETTIRDASDRFAEAAVRDMAVAAYMEWAEASLRHYTLQVRVATVAPLVGLEATPGERLNPPPFSQALDAAIDLHVAALSGRIRDEAAEEISTGLGDNVGLDLSENWPSNVGNEQ